MTFSALSFPSYSTEAVFASADAWSTPPSSVLGDLTRPRMRAVATTSGLRTITFTLPVQRQIQFIGLVHHNGSLLARFRVYLFSDNNPDPVGNVANIVYDSGPAAPWGIAAAVPQFAGVRPFVLPAAIGVQSGAIVLNSRAAVDAIPWQLGGVEISGIWSFTDIDVAREFGLKETVQYEDAGGGVQHAISQWTPRTLKFKRKAVARAELETTAMDFFAEKRRTKPFVWMYDKDSTSWSHQCFLVHNRTLPNIVTNTAATGSVAFDLIEHLGS